MAASPDRLGAPRSHRVTWLFHATAIVGSYEETLARLGELFGCVALEDTRLLHPNIGRRGGLSWLGDNALELGEPIVPGGGAARFIERFGPGVHSIALEVADLEATIAHLEAHDVRIAARPSETFVFSDPRDTEGILFQWWSGRQPLLPRFGGVVPTASAEPRVPVISMAFIAATVARPASAAPRLADILGTAAGNERPRSGVHRADAVVSLVNVNLALYSFDRAADLWQARRERPGAHAIGLTVRDLDEAARGLAELGVAPLWREDGLVTLPPTATGDVPILLAARAAGPA